MARLSRKETHAQTRARLVATGTELFLSAGYNRTSLLQVAEAAGFTKGAVYSNFATKDELGLAVLTAVHEQRAAALLHELTAATSRRAAIDAFIGWAETNIGDVEWTAFEVEFGTSAVRNDDSIRGALAAQRRQLTDGLAALLDHVAATFGIELPLPASATATHLLALGIGLGVQRAFDPDLGLDTLFAEVERLLPDPG